MASTDKVIIVISLPKERVRTASKRRAGVQRHHRSTGRWKDINDFEMKEAGLQRPAGACKLSDKDRVEKYTTEISAARSGCWAGIRPLAGLDQRGIR